jgi:hypothetical protein
MNTVNSNNSTEYPVSVSVSGSEVTITYTTGASDDDNAFVLSDLSVQDLRTCAADMQTHTHDYYVGAVTLDWDRAGLKIIACLNKNIATKSAGLNEIRSDYGRPLMFFAIPFSDSTVSDITYHAHCGGLEIDGTAVTNGSTDAPAVVMANALPSLSLTKSGDDITAQLLDADGNNLSKSGVEIYFETTTGYLGLTRATTDANGQCTVTLNGGVSGGKVKAGFKYFSGAAEVSVS